MKKKAPRRSTNVFSDIRYYLFSKPPVKTRIAHNGTGTREELAKGILQRTGVDVENYKMLNVHKVGIDTPASYVFEELLRWNGDAICWPNHIAKLRLQHDSLEHIKIYLFGFKLFRLFDLFSLRIQSIPDPSDHDNARYLLYECKGGYPIGVFSMYVRSSIPDRGEKEMSQLFMMVSFNFFGRSNHGIGFIKRIWEGIHNRVTSNVVYRIKELCEWKFESFTNE